MSNASNRAERYRDLAEECRRLAATTLSTQMRRRYLRMAENYGTRADVEGTGHASSRSISRPGDARRKNCGGIPSHPGRHRNDGSFDGRLSGHSD